MALSAQAFDRLDRVSLTSRQVERLIPFYEAALGATLVRFDEVHGDELLQCFGVPRCRRAIMQLGKDRFEIVEFDPPGKAFPKSQTASSLSFQHFAIVVSDIQAAYQALSDVQGWAPISTHGPITLPENTGSVTAFKFRDPEGHPLELLYVPAETARPASGSRPGGASPWERIDHSAIRCTNRSVSEAFYAGLGLRAVHRSMNRGIEQQQLDDLTNADVEVVSLASGNNLQSGLKVELLCYISRPEGPGVGAPTDVASTRLVFESADQTDAGTLTQDPDGHWIHRVKAL